MIVNSVKDRGLDTNTAQGAAQIDFNCILLSHFIMLQQIKAVNTNSTMFKRKYSTGVGKEPRGGIR